MFDKIYSLIFNIKIKLSNNPKILQSSTFSRENVTKGEHIYSYHPTDERVCPDYPDENFQNHLRVYQFGEQFVHGKTVLDVGCGTGYGSRYFVTQGAKSVVAIDNSEDAIEYAKSRYSDPGIEFIRMDAQDIKYQDESFDVAFSSENLEHLPDPEKNIAHLRRILKNGGLLVLGTPNKEMSSPDTEKSSNLYHTREFNYEELEALLKKYFNSVYIFENTLPSPSEIGRRMKEERRKKGKIGIEPGTETSIQLGKLRIDLRNLHNTHSFMAIAW